MEAEGETSAEIGRSLEAPDEGEEGEENGEDR